jgi:hypothetical protein
MSRIIDELVAVALVLGSLALVAYIALAIYAAYSIWRARRDERRLAEAERKIAEVVK